MLFYLVSNTLRVQVIKLDDHYPIQNRKFSWYSLRMKKLYLSLESGFIPVSVSWGSNKFISTDHTLPPPLIRRGWMLVHRITCRVNQGNHYGTICRLYKLANYSVGLLLFSFLSGLLVGYLSFRRMDKNSGRLPLFQFYFHRFWRWSKCFVISCGMKLTKL